jgi:hypothetical protein
MGEPTILGEIIHAHFHEMPLAISVSTPRTPRGPVTDADWDRMTFDENKAY